MKPHASEFLSEGRCWQIVATSLDGTDSAGLTYDSQQCLADLPGSPVLA